MLSLALAVIFTDDHHLDPGLAALPLLAILDELGVDDVKPTDDIVDGLRCCNLFEITGDRRFAELVPAARWAPTARLSGGRVRNMKSPTTTAHPVAPIPSVRGDFGEAFRQPVQRLEGG